MRGFDPDPATVPDAPNTVAAVGGARLVLSLTTAAAALEAARAALPALRRGQVYADANTSGAALKRGSRRSSSPPAPPSPAWRSLPVPGRGVRTPALVRRGGGHVAAILGPLGMPVTVLDDEPGAAATRKLLRSVAWKGRPPWSARR